MIPFNILHIPGKEKGVPQSLKEAYLSNPGCSPR
jgi:hypothetical protein